MKKFQIKKSIQEFRFLAQSQWGFEGKTRRQNHDTFRKLSASYLPSILLTQRHAIFRHTNVTINLLRKNESVQVYVCESKSRTSVSNTNQP